MSKAKRRIENGRLDGLTLVCQVPGCRARIQALTGFQELDKLRKHLSRVHLADDYHPWRALELRAKWEEYSGEWPR